MFYEYDVGSLVRMARDHFAKINKDPRLTDEDKRRLKEFYLQNFIAPRARKLLQEYLAEKERDAAHIEEYVRRSFRSRRG